MEQEDPGHRGPATRGSRDLPGQASQFPFLSPFLLFLWVQGRPGHVTGVEGVRCVLRLLGAQSGFPHGEWGREEELGCGTGFTKPGSACPGGKGHTGEEPEAQRGRGLLGRLRERQWAEPGAPRGPPVPLGALPSRSLRHWALVLEAGAWAVMGAGRVDRACLGTQGGAKPASLWPGPARVCGPPAPSPPP